MDERPSVVVEEYLQAIYQLKVLGKPVKAVHITERVGATPSTVHATLSRMQRDGLVKLNEKKQIDFTKDGEEQAKDLIFRHNLAEYFLCNTLGIPWYEVHKHAHQLEHAMTPKVVEKLAEFLEYPEYCPHGVPIRGYEDEAFKNGYSLDEAELDACVKVVMIDETLEDSEELLKHLHDKSVIPGKSHQIIEKVSATRSLTLKSGEQVVTLPFDIAQKIHVVPC